MLSAGSEIRFRVVDGPGRTGASWLLRTHASTGDVYLMNREAGQWMKASFHDGGQWHWAVPPESAHRLPAGYSRYFSVTKEHSAASIAPGWTRALRITVPRSEFRDGWVEKKPGKDVSEIAAKAGFDTAIEILLADEDAEPIMLPPSVAIIEQISRGDGGQVTVIAYPTTFAVDIHNDWSDVIDDIRAGLLEQEWDGSTVARTSVIFHNPEEGFFREIEMVVDPIGSDQP